MNLEKYNRELTLTEQQNNVEVDMYFYIYQLIKEQTNLNNLSLRAVFNRQSRGLGSIFYGISGAPDIAILKSFFDNSNNEARNSDNLNEVCGCVEIKKIGSKLIPSLTRTLTNIKDNVDAQAKNVDLIDMNLKSKFKEKEISQLLGEILWYRKVLYTNGTEWRYFELVSAKDSNIIDKNYLDNVREFVDNEFRLYLDKSKDQKKILNSTLFARLSSAVDYFIKDVIIKEKEIITNIDVNKISDNQWAELMENLSGIKWNKEM